VTPGHSHAIGEGVDELGLFLRVTTDTDVDPATSLLEVADEVQEWHVDVCRVLAHCNLTQTPVTHCADSDVQVWFATDISIEKPRKSPCCWMLAPMGGEEGSAKPMTCARFDGTGGTCRTNVWAAAGVKAEA
jgi:hypothetical protein